MTWSEQYLYGSSRLGSVEPDVTWHNGNDLNDTPYFSDQEKLCIGWKRYEISNHSPLAIASAKASGQCHGRAQ
ncbi:hypothetical protein [Phaeodactylibacter sp.]|uniref:hypothetical protein n=1 Tax=Phaeodactylibacter sp. TaxID=1940289 RepID=UPI0025E7655B|nr:hypothetical protein [Phaeodactylibacter sp.]MCI4646985.1 hypothetical protein [Phaeodactylibacter sp.]MCI5089495.1 hypothetical protein [Phaeodactylibacter sp.]